MQINFNAQSVQPQQPIEPVPEGWYPVLLKSLEPKPVKDKPQCYFLAGELEITDGQYRGRKLFINLNVGNDNPQAVEIAFRELSAICHVTGKYVIGDTNELLNIPFQAKAVVDGNRNTVKGYKDTQGNDPGKAGAGSAPAQPVAAPAAMQPAQGAWGQQPGQPNMAPQQAAQPAWGAQPPAAAPMAAPGGFQPAQQPMQQPVQQQPAWQAAQQPAQAPAAAAPWGQGAPAPAAPAQAAPAGWAPQQQAPAAGGAPWGRAPG
jgi:hypothetical protein